MLIQIQIKRCKECPYLAAFPVESRLPGQRNWGFRCEIAQKGGIAWERLADVPDQPAECPFRTGKIAAEWRDRIVVLDRAEAAHHAH